MQHHLSNYGWITATGCIQMENLVKTQQQLIGYMGSTIEYFMCCFNYDVKILSYLYI